MKKFLVFAIVLPLIAYLPLLIGGLLPAWLNMTLLLAGLIAALTANIWSTLKSFPEKKSARILAIIGLILYVPIVVGFIDLFRLALGQAPVIITGGDGWQDLVAFISWLLFIIPPSYILGTVFLIIARRLER